MIGTLTAAALALLIWPERQSRLRWLSAAAGPGTDVRRHLAGVAGLPLPVTAAVLAAAMATFLSTPLVTGLAAGVAFLGARFWVAGRSGRRAERRLESLTEGLAALAADLRSGRSLDSAARAAVGACADAEVGAALARALRAPGAPSAPGQERELDAALQRISAGVVLSARTGCSLAAVTAAVEDDLRARHRLGVELRTATAGPRASALLLAGLPLLGLAMGSGVGADPWRVLTTTGTGQVLLVVGTALELAGLYWSGHLVQRALR